MIAPKIRAHIVKSPSARPHEASVALTRVTAPDVPNVRVSNTARPFLLRRRRNVRQLPINYKTHKFLAIRRLG
jgi:hypothetical protein